MSSLRRTTGLNEAATAGAPAVTWVVVNTQPHREGVALDNLGRQRFEGYCPKVRRQVRHARQVRQVLRPLFPGYLFVAMAPGFQRWRPLLSTVGVRTVIRFGDAPGYLDPAFVASLKAREVDGAIVLPARRFDIGQSVRFEGGAFDGLVSTIIAMDEQDRLTVLLDLLCGKVRVKVEAGGVSAA